MNQDPTAYFEQFTDCAPDGWSSPQWCWRHWAPCPRHGGNGILATVLLLSQVMEQAAAVTQTTDEINAWMQAHLPLCCHLGDAAMYTLWGQCPPSQQEAADVQED